MQRVELFKHRRRRSGQQRLRPTRNAHRFTPRLPRKGVGLFFAGDGDALSVCQLHTPHFNLLRQRIGLSPGLGQQ